MHLYIFDFRLELKEFFSTPQAFYRLSMHNDYSGLGGEGKGVQSVSNFRCCQQRGGDGREPTRTDFPPHFLDYSISIQSFITDTMATVWGYQDAISRGTFCGI